jgi:nicotinate phosphoribosyltransferase
VAVWDQSRIEPKRWQLDWDGIRHGDYSDRYFWNGVRILQQLAQEGYRFAGHSTRLAQQGLDPQPPEPIGDMRVEMQFFARRKPFTVVAGIDTALAILQHATGYFEGERFTACEQTEATRCERHRRALRPSAQWRFSWR